MELGHVVMLSETNAGSYVPICECGWLGTVHPLYGVKAGESLRKARRRELTRDAARAEHATHCHDVREATAAAHLVALSKHNEYVRTVAPTVRRIGRWGAG